MVAEGTLAAYLPSRNPDTVTFTDEAPSSQEPLTTPNPSGLLLDIFRLKRNKGQFPSGREASSLNHAGLPRRRACRDVYAEKDTLSWKSVLSEFNLLSLNVFTLFEVPQNRANRA